MSNPQAARHCVYVTSPRLLNGREPVVHMARFSDTTHTLCGSQPNHAWTFGDETLSGVSATCRRCARRQRGV